jgi:spore coat protein U-like protein
MNRKKLFAAIIGMLSLSTQAFAGSATANMVVSATVVNNCSITAAPLSFGNYDPISANASSGSDLTGSADLTVACTVGDSYTINLDQGANPGTGSTDAAPARQLVNGSNAMAYQLYQDSGRSTVWGNTSGTSPSSATASSNAPFAVTVYGTVPKGQSLPAGTYTDTVLATVNF